MSSKNIQLKNFILCYVHINSYINKLMCTLEKKMCTIMESFSKKNH